MPDLNEMMIKEKRLLEYIRQNCYDAAVIGRQDNFSWITCGGRNRVVITSENGVCMLIIGSDGKYVVANTMDGQRLVDEEMQGMNYELVNVKWYEGSPAARTIQMLKGKKVLSDVPIGNFDCKPAIFYDIQYPLTENELKRYRWLGAKAEEIIAGAAENICPGMSEHEVEAMLMCEFANNDMTPEVILVGSDERISKYRHPAPSNKTIRNVVMLAPAVRKWGLTLPITRMIYFGNKIPKELAHKYDAVCKIEAEVFALCKPGNRFADIFKMQKQRYADTGYPGEWEKHAQGGITGYVINDPGKCMDETQIIKEKQTFNWYITITGVKVEETYLTSSSGKEILTSKGLWPVKEYQAKSEKFALPQIMIR